MEYLGKMWSTAKHLSKADVALGKNLLGISKALPWVGAAIDFGSMIVSGENVGSAVVKTGAHVAIGFGIAAIVAGSSVPVLILGGVATVLAVHLFDKAYDLVYEKIINDTSVPIAAPAT